MTTASGATTDAMSRSRRPSVFRTRVALGESWMPAPVSSSRAALSNRATRNPRAASASAAVSPPMPAPAIAMLRADKARRSGPGRLVGAFGRPRRAGIERRVVAVEGRAVGADDLAVVAHVEEDMRVVERRPRAHAHELVRPDLDHRHARVVVEMGNDRFRHG